MRGSFLFVLGMVMFLPPAAAQAPRTQATISAPEDVPVGRPILLDGSASRIMGTDARFLWFVRGVAEPISRTVDAIYTPEQTGTHVFRLIVQSTVDGNRQQSTAVHDVTVYRRKAVLIADNSVAGARLQAQVQAASGSGLYVRALHSPFPASSDRFIQFLSDRVGALRGAEAIILWTDPSQGLQAFLQALRRTGRPPELRTQTIVLVADGQLGTLARVARAPYAVLQPERVVVLRPDALNALLLAENVPAFLASAGERGVDTAVIDGATPAFPPWQPLALLVNTMLISGVAGQTVILLLMLPVIATILAFLKQVVGITTFGLFVPSIIALSFLALGWWVGLLYFLFIIVVGTLSRMAVQRLHILFIPKVAIIITFVSLSLLFLLAVNAAFGVVASRDTVFVLLVMSTLAESFLTAKAEQGWRTASWGILQTIAAALLCVFIVQWTLFQTLVLAYPELVLLVVLGNLLIGRYTGLRLSEYVRFRELLRHAGAQE